MSGIDFSDAIKEVEAHWELDDGYFFRLRQGDYDPGGAARVIETLRSISTDDDTLLPRRFVSLTWWMPMFMEWQIDRVAEAGGDAKGLERDIVSVRNALDDVLGVP